MHELTPDDIVAERQIRRYDGSDYLDIVIPWEDVVTWQLTCGCGWTGDQLPAYTDPTHGTRGCPEDVKDRVFLPAWDAHVAPFAALSDLDEMTDQLRDLEQRITEKVHLARTNRASWTQIGRATHLTKQGAQQRWSTRIQGIHDAPVILAFMGMFIVVLTLVSTEGYGHGSSAATGERPVGFLLAGECQGSPVSHADAR